MGGGWRGEGGGIEGEEESASDDSFNFGEQVVSLTEPSLQRVTSRSIMAGVQAGREGYMSLKSPSAVGTAA